MVGLGQRVVVFAQCVEDLGQCDLRLALCMVGSVLYVLKVALHIVGLVLYVVGRKRSTFSVCFTTITITTIKNHSSVHVYVTASPHIPVSFSDRNWNHS